MILVVDHYDSFVYNLVQLVETKAKASALLPAMGTPTTEQGAHR